MTTITSTVSGLHAVCHVLLTQRKRDRRADAYVVIAAVRRVAFGLALDALCAVEVAFII